MTEPRQDLPPDPQLSRLYRDHAIEEPSHAVDQNILSAARQAVAADSQGVRRNGWWQRWRMPLSLVTSVMLTVTLVMLVEHQPNETSTIPDRDKERSDSARERAVLPPIPPAPAPKALPAPAAPQIRESLPKAEVGPGERDSPSPSSTATDRAAEPSSDAKAESAPSRAATSEGALGGDARAAPPRTAAPLAKSRADGARTPVAWLEEIRVLRNAGKAADAEAQLRAFRLAYPDYPLPEDFRR